MRTSTLYLFYSNSTTTTKNLQIFNKEKCKRVVIGQLNMNYFRLFQISAVKQAYKFQKTYIKLNRQNKQEITRGLGVRNSNF